MSQEALIGVERRVDMTVDGADAANLLSPKLAELVRDSRVILEFESKPLSEDRARTMLESLLHAYSRHLVAYQWSPPVGEPQGFPVLIAIVAGIRPALRAQLTPTEETAIYSTIHLGLQLVVVDTLEVPSDSPYAHLLLMHVPRTQDQKLRERQILFGIRKTLRHSAAPRPILERFIMTVLEHAFHDIQQREDIFKKSLFESFDEGEKRGLANLRATITELAARKSITLSSSSLKKLERCTDYSQLRSWLIQIATSEPGAIEL